MVGTDLLLILGVVLLILLIWRGPKVLPQFGEAIGKTVKGIRDNVSEDSDKPDADAARSGADAGGTDAGTSKAAAKDDADEPNG
jgi:Sec-independent protein translocase protein TatA